MKIICFILLGSILATSAFATEGYILDYTIQSRDQFNQTRTTILESLDSSIRIIIVVGNGLITVSRYVKNPNDLLGPPRNYSAADIAHMGLSPGFTIVHQ